jgi:hypothetical protein
MLDVLCTVKPKQRGCTLSGEREVLQSYLLQFLSLEKRLIDEIDLTTYPLSMFQSAFAALDECDDIVVGYLNRIFVDNHYPTFYDSKKYFESATSEDLERDRGGFALTLEYESSMIATLVDSLRLEAKEIAFSLPDEARVNHERIEQALAKIKEEKVSVEWQRTRKDILPTSGAAKDILDSKSLESLVKDGKVRSRITKCFNQANDAFKAGSYLSCIVLQRAIIEALLVSVLLQFKDDAIIDYYEVIRKYSNPTNIEASDIGRWSMPELLKVAVKNHIIQESVKGQCVEFNKSRNGIHLYSDIAEDTDLKNCHLGWYLVGRVHDDILRWIRARLASRCTCPPENCLEPSAQSRRTVSTWRGRGGK